ncbi:hypothetical protein ABQJ54_05015 [Rhodanobacter sp. Si-c]|uniref:DUF2846 domain-containing protein n=1 Tax=Rhodanobacter lycopersici TaxID=3162487 RepID=A0ABV3QBM8_9GAMM
MPYPRTIAVLACVLLAGCASIVDRHPKIAYADKRHPLADTAIFSCVDTPDFTCGIVRVDDRSTWNHYNGGKRVWVRVLPGEHRIGVIASDGKVVNWLSFDAQDVQPGHAYSIEIAEAPAPVVAPDPRGGKQHSVVAASLSASYRDLGKMDSYTIRLGRQTVHVTELTASF